MAFRYRVIMVGTDFSPASRNAVRRATDLALRLGAQLHVVHVLEKLKPALLVLASVGQSHIQDFLIGSTTDRCLRRSQIPVMVVPWQGEGRR